MPIGIASTKFVHVGATPKWTLSTSDLRVEDEEDADQHQQHLREEVDDRRAAR